jgi:hypothetical protein
MEYVVTRSKGTPFTRRHVLCTRVAEEGRPAPCYAGRDVVGDGNPSATIILLVSPYANGSSGGYGTPK